MEQRMTLLVNQQNIDAELEALMSEVNEYFANQGKENPEEFDEEAFATLFNRGLPVYKRLMDECSQADLDAYNEKYDSFYPFFKTIQDQIDNQAE